MRRVDVELDRRLQRRALARARVSALETKETSAVATWTIGAVSVTRVEEQIGFASFPPEQYLAGFERTLLQKHLPWLVPHHYSPEHDRLVTRFFGVA